MTDQGVARRETQQALFEIPPHLHIAKMIVDVSDGRKPRLSAVTRHRLFVRGRTQTEIGKGVCYGCQPAYGGLK